MLAHPTRLSAAAAALVITVLAAAACGSNVTATPPEPSPVQTTATATPIASPTAPPTATPVASPTEPQAATDEVNTILATTVLRVGSQRVAFLLTTSEGIIKTPQAGVKMEFLGEGEAAGQQETAEFHLWPYGVRGAYSTELDFERAGPWRIDVDVEGPNGPAKARLEIEVAEEVGIPDIGSIPPFGSNKTVHTVDRLEQLTTDFSPDPDLYQLTIAEGVISGRPTVVVFATPAFCTSPTCGPQVDTVSELKDLRRDEANFIHVEIYDNPEEIQGDLSSAVITDLVHKWGLSSIPDWFNESWTFVIGRDGRIAQRFEGFATLEELDAALQAVLDAV